MKVLLTGGGTGGHIYPAIALAQAFERSGASVKCIGLAGGIEERLVPEAGIAMQSIAAAPLQRKVSLAMFTTVQKNAKGLLQAFTLIKDEQPDVVISTGGYVSFPVVLAAWLWNRSRPRRRRACIGLLEPNAVPGLTNRLLAPFVDEVWSALPLTDVRLARRAIVTGTPVRMQMSVPLERAVAACDLGLDPRRKLILIIGGSQGARTLNAAVAALLAAGIPEEWQFLQVTGLREEAEWRSAEAAALENGRVILHGYLADPRAAYAAADVVVARAGASTLAELGALGKPALLVPYPFATADHQWYNAQAFAAHGSARVMRDADLDATSLRRALEEMLEDAYLQALRIAAQKVAANDATVMILERVRSAMVAKEA